MGLDITVFTKVEPVDKEDLPKAGVDEDIWDLLHESGIEKVFVLAGFEQSYRGLPGDPVEGAYVKSVGDVWHFTAGSYLGYGEFRRELTRLALGCDPRAVWENADAYRERPFFELINFADNEGSIGPEAAADLAVDFENFLDRMRSEWADFSPHWPAKYERWMRACRDAAGSGMLQFH